MNSKQLLLLPIFFIGLSSCAPDSRPKNLSYNDAISYIKSNAKDKKSPSEGHVEYQSESIPSTSLKDILTYYGVDDPSKLQGNNKIKESYINDYLSKSDNPKGIYYLPLMYLNESNFKAFVEDDNNFSYQLTYVKEFIMKREDSGCVYIRYYNVDLRLTRFEINSSNPIYTVTQSYIY